MPSDALRRLWPMLELQRDSTARARSPIQILELARANAVSMSPADLWQVASRVSPESGSVLCPPLIADFVAALAADERPADVLDPWVACGTLLAPVIEATKAGRFVGVHPNVEAIHTAKLLLPTSGRGEYRAEDPSAVTLDALGPFDLVVSAPPFGMRSERFRVAGMEITDGHGHEILVRSAMRLRERGCGVFVVAPNFLFDSRSTSAAASLGCLGLHVDAVFHVPAGAYLPYTAITAAVVVIRRGPPPAAVFVGEVSDDPARVRALLANYHARRPAGSPELGALVALPQAHRPASQVEQVSESVESFAPVGLPTFHGFPQLAINHRIAIATKRLRLPQQRLGDLCARITRCTATATPVEAVDNAFFLPLTASSVVRFSRAELPKNPKDYVLVVVDPAKADARVVAGFFDSTLGREIRAARSVGATIQRISIAEVADLPVWLPGVAAQRAIVETDQRLRSMTEQLGELREHLWSRLDQADRVAERLNRVGRSENLTEWLDSLPFPLASILWTYHTLSDQPLKQYYQLDYFFEGLVEFLAVVLLSGARQDPAFLVTEWPGIKASLEDGGVAIERASFGTWVTLLGSLAKRIRTELSEGGEAREEWQRKLACDDADLLGALVSKEIVTLLGKANVLRNGWRGHGGVVSDDEARRRTRELGELLLEVRSRFGHRWAAYPLVIPGQFTFSAGTYRSAVRVASGVKYPFEQEQLELQQPMERDVLHLVSRQRGRACPLLPLVRMGPSPSDQASACYFFSRTVGDRLKYVSYHYETRPEIQEPRGGALSVLDGLLMSS